MERIELSYGTCAYEVSGSENAPGLLLVHGLSSPSFVFDAIVPALAKTHRVLRYDLFGRGDSARPHVNYDLSFFLRQLAELEQRVLVAPATVLIGYSWGASIVAARADANTERVVLIAPGGLDLTVGEMALGLPHAGELLTRWFGRGFLKKDLEKCFVRPDAHAAFIARVLAQVDTPGFEHAFLSSLRNVRADYPRLARGTYPVDVVWGEHDRKVPMALYERFKALVPKAKLHPIEPAGHGLLVEHAELVTRTLVQLVLGPVEAAPRDLGGRG